MRCVSAAVAVLATFVLCSPLPGSVPAQAGENDAPKLLKVVALSRHGVRSPTQSPETLKAWSDRRWPEWNTVPGHLTERGADLIRAEWQGLRQSLAFDGLLPASECPAPQSVFVYADNEERTLATARAMLEGLSPGCGFKVFSRPEGTDPLFHPVRSGFVNAPVISEPERKKLTAELSALQDSLGADIARLSSILGPASPALCAPGQISCTLSSMPSALEFPHKDSRRNVSLHGGLSLASTTAEILLLESLEWPERAQLVPAAIPAPRVQYPGTPVEQKARQIIMAPRSDKPDTRPLPFAPRWKPALLQPKDNEILVNPATARQLLHVHTNVQSAVQRFAPVAESDGMPLLLFMTEALAGTSPVADANKAALVFLAGHDTNIVNLAGLLDLHWNNDPFPADSTPPGSMLVFRLWETEQGNVVQASFLCQTDAAFLSTDNAVMSRAALKESALMLPNATADTPAGPGLPLASFLALVRGMAGDELTERLPEIFAGKPRS